MKWFLWRGFCVVVLAASLLSASFAQSHNSSSQNSALNQTTQYADIPSYDDLKPIASVHAGRLVRVSGRLTSLVIARDSVTYGITTKDGSIVFVRGKLPAKYAHTGVLVSAITRVPEDVRMILTLELVEFEQPKQGPSVSHTTQVTTLQQASVERRSNMQPAPQQTPAIGSHWVLWSNTQPNMPLQVGQTNAVPIYSAWWASPQQGGVLYTPSAQANTTPLMPSQVTPQQLQPLYVVPTTSQRGTLPSRGISDVRWRSEYEGVQRSTQVLLPSGSGKFTISPPSPQTNVSYSNIQREVERLLNAYKSAAIYFNPSLTDEQATKITRALLYYSLLYGVDPRFVVAVIAAESSFRPNAVGSKGEIGLGQLMPSTAASLGISNPFDIEQNIEGCVRLLSRYLTAYSHLPPEQQIALALACYNAGPNAVAKYGGVPPYPITQRYIKRVTEFYKQLCGIR
ncbi:MAG: hypothetical protein RUDDFDWM_001499 [Candidatus Fervidibacterota bacterium]